MNKGKLLSGRLPKDAVYLFGMVLEAKKREVHVPLTLEEFREDLKIAAEGHYMIGWLQCISLDLLFG